MQFFYFLWPARFATAKKRKTSNDVLYQICENFSQYDSVLSYMFEVAKYFGHDQ